MNAGLVAQWDTLEFYLNAAFSTSAPGTGGKAGGGTAKLTTSYAPDYLNVNPGITIQMTSVVAGPASVYGSSKTIYTLTIPDLSISNTDTVAGFSSSANCRLVFTDFKCYAINGGVWRLAWSDLSWYRNGTLDTSYGADSIISGAYLSPTAIPIIGFPATLEAGGVASPAPAIGPTGTGMPSDSLSGDCTITDSGWRYKIGSTWLTPPVNCSVLGTPTLSCSASPSIGTVSASNTYNGAAYGSNAWTQTSAQRTWNILSAKVTLLPNIPRSVKRMNDDYAALIFRWGLPKAQRHATKTCEYFPPDGESTLTSATTNDTVFNSYTYILSTVQNAPHVIEDPLNETIYAPYRVRGEAYVMNPGGVTVGERNSSLDEQIEDSTANPQMCGALYHVTPIYRYVNYCASPHWSYFYWWPADADTNFWKLDGAKVNSEDYWVPIRTQYLENSSLPSDERLKTRNSIVAAPLLEGCYSQYIKDYFFANSQSSWWGISRWKAKQYNGSPSVALTSASEPDWAATDCVLTFGATKITVNVDSGKTTGILEYDLGQFAREPYLYGHYANSASLNWITTNVSAVRMYLVSANGEKELMGSTVGTHQKAFVTGTKYVGSWAQDFGYGGWTTDVGADTQPSGQSALAMTDAELWITLGQVGARNGANLRIEVDVVNASIDADIYYPTLYRPSVNPTVYHEHGHCSLIAWPSGPGLRYGQQSWLRTVPVTSLLNVPDIFEIGIPITGWKSSALDYFCWRNVVLRGKNRSDLLAATIRTEYDNYELIGTDSDPSNNNQVYRECDSFTISFVTSGGNPDASLPGGTYHLVNTCQEVPPLPHFPYALRDDDTFQLDLTQWAQDSYALDQGMRYVVSAAPSTEIVQPSPSTGVWTALASGAPTGWQLVKHNHQVNNDETDNFRLRADGTFYATLSPYHGYSTLLFNSAAVTGGVDYDVSRSWRHARGYVDAGTAWLGFKSNEGTGWTAVDTTLAADSVSICYPSGDADDRLRLLIAHSGTLTGYLASESGTTTMAFTLGSGDYGDLAFSPNNVMYGLRLNSGTIYVKAYDTQGNLIGSEMTSNITGIDEAPIAAETSVGSGGELRLHVLYTVSGSLVIKTSLNGGATFS